VLSLQDWGGLIEVFYHRKQYVVLESMLILASSNLQIKGKLMDGAGVVFGWAFHDFRGQ